MPCATALRREEAMARVDEGERAAARSRCSLMSAPVADALRCSRAEGPVRLRSPEFIANVGVSNKVVHHRSDWRRILRQCCRESVPGFRGANSRLAEHSYRNFVQISDSEVTFPSRGFFWGGDCVYSVLPSSLN